MGKFKDLVTEGDHVCVSPDGKHFIVQPEYYSLLEIIRAMQMRNYEKEQAAGSTASVLEGSGSVPNWQLYFNDESSDSI